MRVRSKGRETAGRPVKEIVLRFSSKKKKKKKNGGIDLTHVELLKRTRGPGAMMKN